MGWATEVDQVEAAVARLVAVGRASETAVVVKTVWVTGVKGVLVRAPVWLVVAGGALDIDMGLLRVRMVVWTAQVEVGI